MGLQCGAQLIEFVDVVSCRSGNDRTTPRRLNDETFAAEELQCLPKGPAADVQLVSELSLDKPLATSKSPRQDLVT